jgi:O-antigen/teichoic acid export membrane protein
MAAEESERRSADIHRQVAFGTAVNYVGRVINLGVWFVLTPIIFSHLGKTQFGLWALVASFVAYGSLADVGIAAALAKYVAEYRARGDNETASELIATALWLYCGLGIAVLALSAVFAPFVNLLINVPAHEHAAASWIVVLTGVGVAVQLPSNCAISVLRGLNRYDLMNLIGSLAMLTLGAGIAVVLLVAHGKAVAITALTAPVTLLWLVPTIWLVHRTAPELRFGFRGARRHHARRVLLFSSALFGIQVAQAVKLQSDEVVIGAALPVRFVSPYSVARKLSTLPGQLTNQFVLVLMPLASRLHVEGDAAMLREIYLSGIRLTIALFALVGAALIVFAKPFLLAWTPGAASSADIVVLLTLAALLEAVMSPVSQALQGMARHRPLVIFALGSAALNLALSIALVGPLGVRGVAIGTLVATCVEAAVTLPFGARVLGVGTRSVVRGVLVPGLLPLIPAVVALVAIHSLLAPSTIVTIALSGLACAPAHLQLERVGGRVQLVALDAHAHRPAAAGRGDPQGARAPRPLRCAERREADGTRRREQQRGPQQHHQLARANREASAQHRQLLSVLASQRRRRRHERDCGERERPRKQIEANTGRIQRQRGEHRDRDAERDREQQALGRAQVVGGEQRGRQRVAGQRQRERHRECGAQQQEAAREQLRGRDRDERQRADEREVATRPALLPRCRAARPAR